jgi:hypothetical protein
MKKLLSLLASFVLGFTFFMGAAAVAINATGIDSSEQSTEEQPATSSSEEPSTTGSSATGTGSSGDVYCFNIGKDNELDGDCFCVQDEVSDMDEVDCLINSGIVPASSRDGYIQYLRSLESNP